MNRLTSWIIKTILRSETNFVELFDIINKRLEETEQRMVLVSNEEDSPNLLYPHKSPTNNPLVNKIYPTMRTWTDGPKILFVTDKCDAEIQQMRFNPNLNVVVYTASSNILLQFLRDYKRSTLSCGTKLRVAPTFYFLNKDIFDTAKKLQPSINSFLIN